MGDVERRTTVRETTGTPPPAAESVYVEERTSTRRGPMSVIRDVIVLLFGILQVALVLRVVLLLLIADRANDIVSIILNLTDPFVEPFRGMFALDRAANGSGSVLDIAALVALLGWTLIELLILAVLRIGRGRATTLD